MARNTWIDVGSGHRVMVLDDGGVIWEHDTPSDYRSGSYIISRHEVSPAEGETWEVTQEEPISLHPSLHCSVENGGCGAHGWITNGRWSNA